MTNNFTKFIFLATVFVFIVSVGAIGVAALFDKTVVNKEVRTVVKKIEEKVTPAASSDNSSSASNSTTPSTGSQGSSSSTSTNSGSASSTSTSTAGSGYTLADVSKHGASNGCWVVYNNNIYQLGSYSSGHPGGSNVGCGRDITSLINANHKHSSAAMSLLQSYFLHALMAS